MIGLSDDKLDRAQFLNNLFSLFSNFGNQDNRGFIVCPFGLEDKKLLLFDNFKCWDEGCLIGNVSKETIQKLRKSN